MASQPAPEFADEMSEYAPMDSAAPQPQPSYDEEAEEPAAPRGPRILWVAAGVTLVWLAAAAATVYLLLVEAPARDVALTEWAAVAAGIFAPVTAIWLIALAWLRVDPGRGRRSLARIEEAEARFHAAAGEIEARVGSVDRLLTDVAARTEALAAQLAQQGDGFEQSAGRAADIARAVSTSLSEDRERIDHAISRLAERGELTHDRLSALGEMLPLLTEEAGRVGDIFTAHTAAAEARTQDIAALVADLEARGERAAAAATERGAQANELLIHVDRTVRDADAALAEQRRDLEEALAAAIAGSQAAVEDMRQA
ncbi:MAG TPA: hypothetical protein VFJ13_11740, partial [Paracoccaceae bacterium]|nr:hypothetical protein [Paracoccaceae bacterium]